MNRSGPFDASPCPQATLADLDAERMAWFIDRARQVRGFPLPPNASASELLTHLNLLPHGQPMHAAVLLFGRQPQRFLISSEVKVSSEVKAPTSPTCVCRAMARRSRRFSMLISRIGRNVVPC